MSDKAATAELGVYLKTLKLPSFASDYAALARTAEEDAWSFERYLSELCEREVADRAERRIERLLRQSGPLEVLPNLTYLPNGATYDLGGLIVGGVGGCHGPSNYGRRTRSLQGYAKRHYTREDIDALIDAGHVDILLTHDAPAGVVFPRHRMGANWASEAAGLDDLVRALRPSVCFFGHHHQQVDGEIDGIPCVGLNIVGRPGNLVAVDLGPGGPWSVLGEWPAASASTTHEARPR
jgi:hypothetical protein